MEEVLSDKYKIEEAKLKNPKIIVVGVEEDVVALENEDILNKIINQNDFEDCGDKIKILAKYTKKNRKNIRSIILEAEASTFKQLMRFDQLNVGWRKCNIYEHVNVRRCMKCADYNHIYKDCPNEQSCFNVLGITKLMNLNLTIRSVQIVLELKQNLRLILVLIIVH